MLKSSKLGDRFKKNYVISPDNNINSAELKNKENNHNTGSDVEFEMQDSLLSKINSTPVWFEYSDLKQKELIKNFVEKTLDTKNVSFSDSEKTDLIEKMYNLISGFGPLDYLLSQQNVSSVFVNSEKNVHIEINGKVLNTEIKLDNSQINLITHNIFKSCNSKYDASKTIYNLKNDKYFITLITPPASVGGINIMINKIIPADINTLFEKNITSKEIFDFLISAISEHKNIVISGDINSGKTFFLNVLINSMNSDMRSALIEQFPHLSINAANMMKFSLTDTAIEKEQLLLTILKICPEYIFTDLNEPVCNFSDKNGYISTLNSSSVDAAITKLTTAFMAQNALPEKYAKAKVLTDFDYIIQINKMSDGASRITSVVELKPARTMALSLKVIAKLVDGQYITEIPQPLTSIRADSLISQGGSMYSRFRR